MQTNETSKSYCGRTENQFLVKRSYDSSWAWQDAPKNRRKKIADCHPILVSIDRVDQLLAVPRLPSRSGEATAAAVQEAALFWWVSENVKAMSFDTTAVNTGRLNCACALLEQKMRKELLWLACRHYVLEIVLASVTSHLLESCKSSGVVIFRRFQSQWAFIDKT